MSSEDTYLLATTVILSLWFTRVIHWDSVVADTTPLVVVG
jgi:hypothetical protein